MIAPTSSPNAQMFSRWLRMRVISANSTRMYWPRGGGVDPHQLLDRQREGMLLAHRRDVIEPVEIGDRLQVGLVLDQLFGAAVQQADMRVGALDDLAVHLQHQPHHAVRRRMLRPEIHREIADRRRAVEFVVALGRRADADSIGRSCRALRARRPSGRRSAFSSPGRMLVHPLPRRQEIEAAEFLLQLDRLVDDALLLLVVAQLDIAGQREILAQRMPVKPVIGQDAAQIGMVAEIDAVTGPRPRAPTSRRR